VTGQSSHGPQAGIRPRELSRDKIIAAGVSLLDSGGTDAVTMRALADLLSVTPMALYNHVDDKTDLLYSIAAHLLETARFDCGKADWRARIEHCFREFRALCLRHPGLAGLLERAGAAPSRVFAPMEVTVGALRSIGFDDVNALRCFFTLVSFTLGQVTYQHRGPFADLTLARHARENPSAALDGATARPWDFDAAYEFGLRLILDGVEAAAGPD
jgi:TetR/AcrR family tetracycline transcriptional repressor